MVKSEDEALSSSQVKPKGYVAILGAAECSTEVSLEQCLQAIEVAVADHPEVEAVVIPHKDSSSVLVGFKSVLADPSKTVKQIASIVYVASLYPQRFLD